MNNRETILTSKADIEAAPLGDYHFPPQSGSFTGTLVYRRWHPKKPALLCYFDADDGNQYVLMAWWQSWGVPYCPKKTHINFADEVLEGSRWYCEYQKKEKGYIAWQTAACL